MERITRFRAGLVILAVVLVMSFFSWWLYTMQIEDVENRPQNMTTYKTYTRIRAARGDIVDTNGNVLVTNRVSYDLVFNHYVLLNCGNPNERLLELAKLCQRLDISYGDHLPISKEEPFEYTLSDFSTAWQAYFQAFLVNRGNLDSDIPAPVLLQELRKSYYIPDSWTAEDARLVIGLRYELTLRNGVTNLPNYIFKEDVSDSQLAAILELNVPGLQVEDSTVRQYNTAAAAHVLGYIGAMSTEQWAVYKEKGYAMDALVGQSGFELAFESYLHGVDGVRVDEVTADGTVIKSYYEVEPVSGGNVEVSLDLAMQMAAEEALESTIINLRSDDKNAAETGHDAEGGAVVALDVKTGQVLVCGSYPTFDLSKLFSNWNEINAAPFDPLVNRALNATYAPGSTYKPLMVIAGIEAGAITPEESIYDRGVYTKYQSSGFAPTCLQYANYGYTHGSVTAATALKYSCNYYFYVLAERLDIQQWDSTAAAMGLGEPTGVELYEYLGRRANVANKAQLYAGTDKSGWYKADQVMAGIGQSINKFTPIQLASYTMALANRGTRYKATFLDRVLAADYGSVLYENQSQVLTQFTMSDLAYSTYLDGMKQVTEVSGTAYTVFKNYPVKVAAKTGTAETDTGSANGAFICFAPADDPQIAICVYGEKAGGGSRLASVARAILDVYFGYGTGDGDSFENQLG